MADGSIPPPLPEWMYKTRSQHTKELGLLSILKSGASSWSRRYVWVEGTTLYYGPNASTPEKTITSDSIASIGPASSKRLKTEGAPDVFVNFGWEIKQGDKITTLVCESLEARDRYMQFFSQFVGQRHRAQTVLGSGPSSAALASEPSSANMSIAAQAAAQAAAKQQQQQQQAKPARAAAADDDDDAAVGNTKSARELNRLMGAADDDDDELALDASDDDEFDDDDDDDDDDSDAEDGGSSRVPVAKVESATAVYERILRPIAKHAHLYSPSHEPFKDELAKNNESLSDIVFSRYIAKVAKRDNIHDRDLVITLTNMYLFVKGTFGGYSARVIPLNQVIGVLESTIESSLFAIIIPSFHDVLVRVTLFGTPGEPTESEIKKQIIAHIFVGSTMTSDGREFMFREAENIRELIRRTDDADHLPLECGPGDRLHAALNPSLYPTFRVNADAKVVFSAACERVNAQMAASARMICATDGGVYLCTSDGSRVSRRFSLSELDQLKYDGDTMSVLMQFPEMDLLVVMRLDHEFQSLIDVVPKIASGRQKRSISVVPSKTLRANARLADAKKLADHLDKAKEQGIRKGMKLGKMILRRGLQYTGKKAGRLGAGILSIGKEGIDLVKTGVVNVGGVLVDNAVAGELLGAANILLRHERIFHETIITLRDEKEALEVPVGDCDTMKLQTASAVAAAKISALWFSARCKLYNVAAHVDTDKALDLVITLTDKGVYFFEDPSIGDTGLFATAIQMIRSDKGYNLTERVKWNVLRGVVRCEAEPNVVGLITSQERSTDILIRVSNATLSEKFVAIFVAKYAEAQSKEHCPILPLVYSSSDFESMKAALKKTTFDLEPTIALRQHRFSDANNIATVAEVIDTIRRHGDNKVYFSGLAWRFRSSMVKQGTTKMEKALGKEGKSSDDRKNWKSFILVLTNCAVYFLNKGSCEVVRRTEVSAVQKVLTSTDDPDDLLIKIKAEYDIFMRIEGRAKEFIERLQDAVAEWTPFSLYLPGENRGSHDIRDFTFPVDTVTSLVKLGDLEKPANFNELQAKRNAADVKRQYLSWFDHDLAKSMLMPQSMLANAPNWAAESKLHSIRVARMKHSLERAFSFGLRPSTCPPMVDINRLLDQYARRDLIVKQMNVALETDDADLYDDAVRRSAAVPISIDRMKTEQKKAYNLLKRKSEVIRNITAICDAASRPDGPSIESFLTELDKHFEIGAAMNISQTRLAELRTRVSFVLQRSRMQHVLKSVSRTPSKIDPTTREVVAKAAESLDVSSFTRASVFDANGNPMLLWAQRMLDQAVRSGAQKRISDAIATVKKLDAAVVEQLRAGPLAEAEAELAELVKAQPVIAEIEVRTSELRENVSQLDALKLAASAQMMKNLEARLPKCASVTRARSLVQLYIERVEERMSIAESKEARRAAEQRADAEYQARIRAREAEQERLREEQRQQRQLEEQERRAKILKDWVAEAEKQLFNMKAYVSSDDNGTVATAITACTAAATSVVELALSLASTVGTTTTTSSSTVIAERVEEILQARGPIHFTLSALPAAEQDVISVQLDKVLATLRTARQLGTLYLTQLREKQNKALDPNLLVAIRNLDKLRVLSYLNTFQGRGLTIEAVSEIRNEWNRAAEAQQWAKRLHAKVHQAVALRNLPLLEAQLDLARSKNYSDAVVVSAREWLTVQRAAAGAAAAADAAADAAASTDAAPAAPAVVPPPKPVVYDLMHGWPPKEPKTAVVRAAHDVVKRLVSHPSNTRSTAIKDGIRLHCHADPNHPDYKSLYDALNNLLGHRVKPAGFFRKTERTLPDVLAYIGNLERKGDVVAPFTNHLLGEFDRVKKLNHLNGATPAILLVKLLLCKQDLLRFIDDLFACTPKELEDVYFEDSVFRSPNEAERKDLRLLAKMLLQVEWPFSLEDRADAALVRPAAVEVDLLTADKEQRTVPRAVNALRRSIGRISTHFSKELARLGTRPDAAAVAAIFDENADRRIGLLVRESFSAAVSSLLLVGFRTSSMFQKRHLWDFFKASAERLRQSARGLGGVGMPEAIDLIENLTNPDSVGRRGAGAALSSKSEQHINDVRVRMFYAHALNQRQLATFLLDAMFDDSDAGREFLDKYYHLEKAVFLQTEAREEVEKVLSKVSSIPFILTVDAELW